MKLTKFGATGLILLILALLANDIFLLSDFSVYPDALERFFGISDSSLTRSDTFWLGMQGLFLSIMTAWVLVDLNLQEMKEVSKAAKYCYGAVAALIALRVVSALLLDKTANAYIYSGGAFRFIAPLCATTAAILVFLRLRKEEDKKLRTAEWLATAVFLLFAAAKLSPTPLVSAAVFAGQGSLFPIYTAVNIALGCLLLFHNRITTKLANSTATAAYAAIVPSAEFRIFGIVLIILTPSFFLLPRPAELNEIAYSILMLLYGLFLRRTSAERTPANT